MPRCNVSEYLKRNGSTMKMMKQAIKHNFSVAMVILEFKQVFSIYFEFLTFEGRVL